MNPSQECDSSHCSVRVEKIDNGYLRHESRSNGSDFTHSTTYHEQKPPEAMSKDLRGLAKQEPAMLTEGKNSLARAMKHALGRGYE